MVAANRNIDFQAIRNETLAKDRHDLAKLASLVGSEEGDPSSLQDEVFHTFTSTPASNESLRRRFL